MLSFKLFQQSKNLGIALICFSTISSGLVYAEEIDGAKILEMEASRAQELTRLEHRARIAEQQARIAEAEKKLREAGGVVSYGNESVDFGYPPKGPWNNPEQQRSPVSSEVVTTSIAAEEKEFEIPKLKSIDGNIAVLTTQKHGALAAVPGINLPEGFKVVSVDPERGVTMIRKGVTYIAQYAWK